jgi:short-subunit dehydrogenase
MSRRILITGASSGLGRALALHYARSEERLILAGRNAGRLSSVAAECTALGSDAITKIIDVRDRGEMTAWITALDRDDPIDMVVANAGVMSGTPPAGDIEPPDAAYALMETNVLGALNTIQPLLAPMMARKRGQIAIVSSLAAFIPLPDSPSYCASKSAILNYGLSLRTLLRPHGVKVSVICPGYVETPMSARENANKPQLMSPEAAATIAAEGLRRDKSVIAFPRILSMLARFHGILPDAVRRWLMRGARFTVSG